MAAKPEGLADRRVGSLNRDAARGAACCGGLPRAALACSGALQGATSLFDARDCELPVQDDLSYAPDAYFA